MKSWLLILIVTGGLFTAWFLMEIAVRKAIDVVFKYLASEDDIKRPFS